MGNIFVGQEIPNKTMNVQETKIANELLKNHHQNYGKGVEHSAYISNLGKIRNPQRCGLFQIDNSDCEELLENAEYYFNSSIGLKEKTLQIFYETVFSLNDLKKAVESSIQEKAYLRQYFQAARLHKDRFMREMRTDIQTSEACCLAISYYTGFFQESIDRSSNLIIKLASFDVIDLIKKSKELKQKMCIGYWLLRAINYLPLYVGRTTRCIDLKPDEEEYYNQGNLITWLQFSSSSEGDYIHPRYEKRNARFYIYSISGRKIEQYSTYNEIEKEILFKPFTHFLILKKERKDNVLHIYMREIAIGQASLNVLWVDDAIFSPTWRHKALMEEVMKNNPKITFIPKSSTNCAMAFMKSEIGSKRKKTELRIVTTLVRQNEPSPNNAGIVLLKQLEDIHINNLKILIFTPTPEVAKTEKKKLLIRLLLLQYTSTTEQLQKFIQFNDRI